MASSIEQLRIYTSAQALEDQVYELVKAAPAEQYYPLGNNLRRASAAVSHYINEAHTRYSYHIKIESLHSARTEAEKAQRFLEDFGAAGLGQIKEAYEGYTAVIKQVWGLIKYFKTKQAEKETKAEVSATDELVAARS